VSLPEPQLSREQLQEILTVSFGEGVPLVDEVTGDGVTVRYQVNERNARPGGTLSGPTMMMLADTAAWVAIMSRVGPELLAVTTSLTINFLRKPSISDLVAEASLDKLGRKLGVVSVRLYSEDSRDLVATASVTYARPS
jgi:uncharacterized protein (TIGR00369 family)